MNGQSNRSVAVAAAAKAPVHDPLPLQDQVETLLNLVMGHCEGKITNNEVETAVTTIVDCCKPKASNNNNIKGIMKKKKEARISSSLDVDEDDYDNIGDKNDNTFTFNYKENKTNNSSSISSNGKGKKEETKVEDCSENEGEDEDYIVDNDEELENIPLGRQGSKMMIIYGDGPHPKPASVSAALLGVRQCLHQAIKEARALRRKMRMEYDQAKSILDKHGAVDVDGVESQEVDPNMYFKALIGRDRKGIMEIGCGFDMTQLKTLFPEEMREFQRWKTMHEEYVNSTETEIEATHKNASSKHATAPGHLRNRLAQFDIRTDNMKSDSYLNFAELRRHGFLSRALAPEGASTWNKIRLERPEDGSRRKRKVGTWEALNPASIQFLHWLGFDPNSSLPPPNEDTTNVLSFLAYDFMGKIVEKAVSLRFKHGSSPRNNSNFILQLPRGEQLDPSDIQKVMNSHSSIHAVTSTPIYSSSFENNYTKTVVTPQLYFGPGFEKRLEAELQLHTSKKSSKKKTLEISAKEKLIRQQEDELFKSLSQKNPIQLDCVFDVCEDNHEMKKKFKENLVVTTRKKLLKKKINSKKKKIKPRRKKVTINKDDAVSAPKKKKI